MSSRFDEESDYVGINGFIIKKHQVLVVRCINNLTDSDRTIIHITSLCRGCFKYRYILRNGEAYKPYIYTYHLSLCTAEVIEELDIDPYYLKTYSAIFEDIKVKYPEYLI